MSAGSIPLTRYSSTSLHAVRDAHGDQRGALPGSIVPNSSPKPSASAPIRVALSSIARAGTSGRQRAHRRQLGEHVQILDAGQAVGADRDAHAGRVECVDGRAAGADPAVAARTGHDVAPPRPAAPARRRRAARRARPAAASDSSPNARCTPPDRSRAASIRDSTRPAPRARAESARRRRAGTRTSSGDSPRWMLASGVRACSPAIAANSAGDTEYGACGARLTRTPGSISRTRVDPPPRGRHVWVPVGDVEAQQLVEHVRRHADVVQQCGAVTSVLLMSPTTPVPRRAPRRWHRRIALDDLAGGGSGYLPRSDISARIHASNDAAGGTRPRIQHSSRCVCALTSAGRIANGAAGSNGGAASAPAVRRPPIRRPQCDPASTATQPSRIGGAGDRQHPGRRDGPINQPVQARLLFRRRSARRSDRSPGGRLVSPSARATASSSMRGTSRSRKIGSPRIS